MTPQYFICLALQIYGYVLFGRVILSFVQMFKPDWRPPSGLMPIIDFIYAITEPPLQLLRRVIPQPMGVPLDLSFIVLFILLRVIMRIVCF